MIKYVLSDLDGVIRHFPKEINSAAELKNGLPVGSILSTAFERELLANAVCGRITDEEWSREVVRRLSTGFPQGNVELAVNAWTEFPGVVDPQYLEALARRFPGVPVALLTNATTRLPIDLKKLGLQDRFARIFNSSAIGVCKPDPEVYKHVVKMLECAPSEILFIDDSEGHVRGAREIGMRGYQYTGVAKFMTESFDDFG